MKLLCLLLLGMQLGSLAPAQALKEQQRQPSRDSGQAAASCGDWSPKFDKIDDTEMMRVLRAHQKQGWNALIQQGSALGANLATQIMDGEKQLRLSRAAGSHDQEILKQTRRTFPEATAKDCESIAEPGEPWMKTACDLHKRQNEVRALEGMLDLLKCRAGPSGGTPALPVGTRVISTFSVHVTPSASAGTSNKTETPQIPAVHPMPKGRIVEVGPAEANKMVQLIEGEYLLVRFPPTGGATGYTVEPGRGVLESEGLYHLPANAVGLVKAVGAGTAIVSVLGSQVPGAAGAGKPQGGNFNDTISPNWSGYVAPVKDIWFISGRWAVPQLWGVGNRSSATWVGIDGAMGSQTVLQAGTKQASTAGFLGIGAGQFYYPWYEFFPSPEQQIPYPVFPGDTMTVSLTSLSYGLTTADASNLWQVWITDSTQNWNFITLVEYKGNLSSAEWIEEAPETCYVFGLWCNLDTLANFQTVTFDDGSMLPGVLPPQPSFNPQPPGPLDSFPPPAFKQGFPALIPAESWSIMQNNVIAATPSNPDGDGDGFTVQYGPSMPPQPGPFVTSSTLEDGFAQLPYSQTLLVSGAAKPMWFSSQLPPGLTLNSSTGVISGTPTTPGTYGIGVWAADNTSNPPELSQLQHLTLTINSGFSVLHCFFNSALGKIVCW